jgi:hypothetical protein
MVLSRNAFSAPALFDPHSGHLVLAMALMYQAMLPVFGMSSPVPFHVVSTLSYLAVAVLLFAYMRRRVGDWPAVLGATVILFFGASALAMLFPFQVCYSGAIAAGCGALLALDRDDRLGDAIACALLLVSTSFSELGIAFAVGVIVRLALATPRSARRLYVGLAPLILYALWWLGWGHTAHSYLSVHNVVTSPVYVVDAVAGALGALVGIINPGEHGLVLTAQRCLLAVVLAVAVWRLWRLGRVPRGVWPVLAVGLSFWVLAAFNAASWRPPTSGRYLYPSAVFILLIASDLMRGVRLGSPAIVAVGAVAVLAVAANLSFLFQNHHAFTYNTYKYRSELSQAELRALEIAGPLNPSFELTLGTPSDPETGTRIDTASYLSAVDAFGSPAYTESELASAPPSARLGADRTLGALLGLRLRQGGAARGRCQNVQASAVPGSTAVTVGAGRVALAASRLTRAGVKLSRFAEPLTIGVGALKPGSRASLAIPADRSTHPWRLGFEGHGPVTVCTL